jgi:hypothetical protein
VIGNVLSQSGFCWWHPGFALPEDDAKNAASVEVLHSNLETLAGFLDTLRPRPDGVRRPRPLSRKRTSS